MRKHLLKIIIYATILCSSISSNLYAADLSVQAYIDGRSHLVIQGGNIWWHHYDFAAPGLHAGVREPTNLNGTQWYPEWPEEGENRDCDCESSKYDQLFPPLADESPIELKIISAREEVSIVQQPSQANDYTAIIEFNDNFSGGPDWYNVVISYESANIGGSVTNTGLTTVICKNVTTGQSLTIKKLKGAVSWNCTAAGLQTNKGDIIKETLTGAVK